MSQMNDLTPEQKNYLQGFVMGSDVARAVRGLPVLSGSAAANGTTISVGGETPAASEKLLGPEAIHREAQDRLLAENKKLCAEEKAKRDKQALDMWDEMMAHARDEKFPKGTDVFLFKFHGLFYVSPAQDAYMCRMRFPGGHVTSFQMRGLADLADRYAGGYTDVTTRANLQLREIAAANGVNVLLGLKDLGIINQGSGGDNIRNVTASPTSGFDPEELIETLPLAREMHHHIIYHRELYGLPRKFNIAFDGAGRITALEDTNDIGFTAVRVTEEHATNEVPAGVYFRLTLGGITGHLDFARDTGILVSPHECVAVSDAILKVFIAHGDRTDRKKARLKYVLDAWGFDKFIEETEKVLGRSLRRFPLDNCERSDVVDRNAHIGVHAQAQPGKSYIGVTAAVGRITSEQMRELAAISEQFGNGTLRLTVWQNVLIPFIDDEDIAEVRRRVETAGLHWRTSSFHSSLVACTGNAGCKYAASNTKRHAAQLADFLAERVELEQPINIHLTGCPHSCAQHYIGDIGLIGTNVEVGEDMVEGYHIFVGGGFGAEQGIGREVFPSVAADDVPARVESLLHAYLEHRESEDESFVAFVRRHETDVLRQMCGEVVAAAS